MTKIGSVRTKATMLGDPKNLLLYMKEPLEQTNGNDNFVLISPWRSQIRLYKIIEEQNLNNTVQQ